MVGPAEQALLVWQMLLSDLGQATGISLSGGKKGSYFHGFVGNYDVLRCNICGSVAPSLL